jgi:hypothetical protein
LRLAGLTVDEAVRVETAFTRFLIALIGLEAALLPELSEEQRTQQARQIRFELESLPPDRFPNLIEAATHIATPLDPDRTFSDASISFAPASKCGLPETTEGQQPPRRRTAFE